MTLAIVADDLTGACDAAAPFAARGLATAVVLEPPVTARAGDELAVLAIDADSRRVGRRAAATRTAAAARAAREAGLEMLFKKVDSTLRGHVAAELAACQRAWGTPLAVLCPAFPAVGRWVQNGHLLVDGRGDVGEVTELAALGRAQVRTAPLPIELVERGADAVAEALVGHLRAGIGVVVADANAPRHLATIAEAAARLEPAPLLAGSAGLARALAERAGGRQEPGGRERGCSADDRARPAADRAPWLVVAGSQTEVTALQVTELARAGAAILALDVDELPARRRLPEEVGMHAARAIGEGATPVIRLLAPAGPAGPTGGARAEDRAARALGRACRAAVAHAAPAGLFLTGGLTARACLLALGAEGLVLDAEPLAGIAGGRARGGAWHGRPLITKAGGFGAPDAIRRLVDPVPSPPRE